MNKNALFFSISGIALIVLAVFKPTNLTPGICLTGVGLIGIGILLTEG